MTLKMVKTEVKNIRTVRLDSEDAHAKEDQLYQAVLKEIALGHVQAQSLAIAALKTRQIKFERWCA